MRIAIIGGGITGLTAAFHLSKSGHDVMVFEKDPFLGGLAHGFKPAHRSGGANNWEWPLEASYHHFFTNDTSLINLAKELSLTDHLIISRPITAAYYDGTTEQLDSPASLLKFNRLSITDRLRTGIMLAYCKINPFWQPLEKVTAESWIKSWGGQAAWKTIWEPLLYGKFNDYASRVAASWFWARIKKRTPRLGYFRGGFQTLIDALEKAIVANGSKILPDIAIKELRIVNKELSNNNINKSLFSIQNSLFDAVLLTVPTPIAFKLLSNIANNPALSIPHLWAQTLILETDKPILDKVYWLNINDRSFPFLAVVAHTNFMDKKYYGGHHLTYFGNYLPDHHPYLKMDKNQLLKIFLPYIQKINPEFKFSFSHQSQTSLESYLFTVPFAQPVHELNYSQKAPKLDTGIPGIYLANMDSIYPWDRGTNYAVELGEKAAKTINR